jgi:plastocyanin
MHRRSWMIVAALSAVFFVATACSSSSSSGTSAVGSSSSSEAPANVEGKSTFELSAVNFFFSPSTLEGSAGQDLAITIKNEGTTQHTFTIDSLNIDVAIDPGQSQQVDVTFPQTGTVQFYCRFHQTNGMIGQLEVM